MAKKVVIGFVMFGWVKENDFVYFRVASLDHDRKVTQARSAETLGNFLATFHLNDPIKLQKIGTPDDPLELNEWLLSVATMRSAAREALKKGSS